MQEAQTHIQSHFTLSTRPDDNGEVPTQCADVSIFGAKTEP